MGFKEVEDGVINELSFIHEQKGHDIKVDMVKENVVKGNVVDDISDTEERNVVVQGKEIAAKEGSLSDLYALFDRANKTLEVIKEENTMMKNWLQDNGIEVKGISVERPLEKVATAKESERYSPSGETQENSYVVIDTITGEPKKTDSGRIVLFDNELQADSYASSLNIKEGIEAKRKEQHKIEQKTPSPNPVKL